jgi:hypothetical protein
VPSSFQLEIIATRSYADLLLQAEETKKNYERAGLQLPAPIARLFSDTPAPARMRKLDGSLFSQTPHVPPIMRHDEPAGMEREWVSIRKVNASPTSIALAILNGEKGPVTTKALAERVVAVSPKINIGSVYNLLNRLLETGDLKKGAAGWELASDGHAGIMTGPYIFLPPSFMTKADFAAHRREAIVHTLRAVGEQTLTKLADILSGTPWVKAPVNKDLLKADLPLLEREGLIRRIEGTKSWEAVTKSESLSSPGSSEDRAPWA